MRPVLNITAAAEDMAAASQPAAGDRAETCRPVDLYLRPVEGQPYIAFPPVHRSALCISAASVYWLAQPLRLFTVRLASGELIGLLHGEELLLVWHRVMTAAHGILGVPFLGELKSVIDHLLSPSDVMMAEARSPDGSTTSSLVLTLYGVARICHTPTMQRFGLFLTFLSQNVMSKMIELMNPDQPSSTQLSASPSVAAAAAPAAAASSSSSAVAPNNQQALASSKLAAQAPAAAAFSSSSSAAPTKQQARASSDSKAQFPAETVDTHTHLIFQIRWQPQGYELRPLMKRDFECGRLLSAYDAATRKLMRRFLLRIQLVNPPHDLPPRIFTLLLRNAETRLPPTLYSCLCGEKGWQERSYIVKHIVARHGVAVMAPPTPTRADAQLMDMMTPSSANSEAPATASQGPVRTHSAEAAVATEPAKADSAEAEVGTDAQRPPSPPHDGRVGTDPMELAYSDDSLAGAELQPASPSPSPLLSDRDRDCIEMNTRSGEPGVSNPEDPTQERTPLNCQNCRRALLVGEIWFRCRSCVPPYDLCGECRKTNTHAQEFEDHAFSRVVSDRRLAALAALKEQKKRQAEWEWEQQQQEEQQRQEQQQQEQHEQKEQQEQKEHESAATEKPLHEQEQAQQPEPPLVVSETDSDADAAPEREEEEDDPASSDAEDDNSDTDDDSSPNLVRHRACRHTCGCWNSSQRRFDYPKILNGRLFQRLAHQQRAAGHPAHDDATCPVRFEDVVQGSNGPVVVCNHSCGCLDYRTNEFIRHRKIMVQNIARHLASKVHTRCTPSCPGYAKLSKKNKMGVGFSVSHVNRIAKSAKLAEVKEAEEAQDADQDGGAGFDGSGAVEHDESGCDDSDDSDEALVSDAARIHASSAAGGGGGAALTSPRRGGPRSSGHMSAIFDATGCNVTITTLRRPDGGDLKVYAVVETATGKARGVFVTKRAMGEFWVPGIKQPTTFFEKMDAITESVRVRTPDQVQGPWAMLTALGVYRAQLPRKRYKGDPSKRRWVLNTLLPAMRALAPEAPHHPSIMKAALDPMDIVASPPAASAATPSSTDSSSSSSASSAAAAAAASASPRLPPPSQRLVPCRHSCGCCRYGKRVLHKLVRRSSQLDHEASNCSHPQCTEACAYHSVPHGEPTAIEVSENSADSDDEGSSGEDTDAEEQARQRREWEQYSLRDLRDWGRDFDGVADVSNDLTTTKLELIDTFVALSVPLPGSRGQPTMQQHIREFRARGAPADVLDRQKRAKEVLERTQKRHAEHAAELLGELEPKRYRSAAPEPAAAAASSSSSYPMPTPYQPPMQMHQPPMQMQQPHIQMQQMQMQQPHMQIQQPQMQMQQPHMQMQQQALGPYELPPPGLTPQALAEFFEYRAQIRSSVQQQQQQQQLQAAARFSVPYVAPAPAPAPASAPAPSPSPASAATSASGDSSLCIVCDTNKRSVVFQSCGHFICCRDCVEEIRRTKGVCPVCRAKFGYKTMLTGVKF